MVTAARDDLRSSVSLITVEVIATGPGTRPDVADQATPRTRLVVTDQIATPHCTDWVSGVEEWWGMVLDRLPQVSGRQTGAA